MPSGVPGIGRLSSPCFCTCPHPSASGTPLLNASDWRGLTYTKYCCHLPSAPPDAQYRQLRIVRAPKFRIGTETLTLLRADWKQAHAMLWPSSVSSLCPSPHARLSLATVTTEDSDALFCLGLRPSLAFCLKLFFSQTLDKVTDCSLTQWIQKNK